MDEVGAEVEEYGLGDAAEGVGAGELTPVAGAGELTPAVGAVAGEPVGPSAAEANPTRATKTKARTTIWCAIFV